MHANIKQIGCCLALGAGLTGWVCAQDNSGRPQPPRRGGFEALDANGDGKLSQAEFAQAPIAKADSAAAFAAADADSDGAVTREEMHGFMMEARFTMLDTDGDGKLSATELSSKSSGHRGRSLSLTELDTDGDGSVTLVEFKAQHMPPPPGG